MNIAYRATRLPSTLRGRTDVNVALPRAAYTSMQRLRGTAKPGRAGTDVGSDGAPAAEIGICAIVAHMKPLALNAPTAVIASDESQVVLHLIGRERVRPLSA